MQSTAEIGRLLPISLGKTIATSGTRIVRGFLRGCGKVFDGSAAPGFAPDAAVQVETARAIWMGKINVYSSDDGIMQFLDERVNRLPTPFELEWHHVSGKPWDWKLVGVRNPPFQIPADAY